jgi:hypothetical protein
MNLNTISLPIKARPTTNESVRRRSAMTNNDIKWNRSTTTKTEGKNGLESRHQIPQKAPKTPQTGQHMIGQLV